jgi:uncharacterized protein YecT (DUF1311 family)
MAEIDGRVQHLKDMKSGGPSGTFDICDDITSGFMMGFCTGLQSEIDDIKRKSTIEKTLQTWPEKDRVAHDKLYKIAGSFFEERVREEVDLSGTARGMFSIQESDMLEDSFAAKTIRSATCGFDNFSAGDFAKADKELNDVYSKIMNSKVDTLGTITKEGIKMTQRKWILYRDAWVAFASVRCPKVTANALQTILTKERVEQLKELAADFEE